MSALTSDFCAPVLAVDPGRDKCGVAVVTPAGDVVERHIVARSATVAAVMRLWEAHHPDVLVLGSATGKRQLEAELRQVLPNALITIVDERESTLEARTLYWAEYPPRGWRRMMPLSLQVPPVPLDDFAAVVLARRYLKDAVG